MNEDKLNAPPDKPPVLPAETNEKVVDKNSNTKSSRLGIWSLAVSIVSPIIILIIFSLLSSTKM